MESDKYDIVYEGIYNNIIEVLNNTIKIIENPNFPFSVKSL
jgi:hypothetical protein